MQVNNNNISIKRKKYRTTLTLRLGQIHFAGMLRGLVIFIIIIIIVVLLLHQLIGGLAGGKDVHVMEDAQAALKLVDKASEVGSSVDDNHSLWRFLHHHVALHCWHHQLLAITPANRMHHHLSKQHTTITPVNRTQNYYACAAVDGPHTCLQTHNYSTSHRTQHQKGLKQKHSDQCKLTQPYRF